MAIVFSCSCGHAMRAADRSAGRRTTCNACGARVRIPAPEPSTQNRPQKRTSDTNPDEDLEVLKPVADDDGGDALPEDAFDGDALDFDLEEFQPSGGLIATPRPRKKGPSRTSKTLPASMESRKSPKKKKPEADDGRRSRTPIALALFAVLGIIGIATVGLAMKKMFSGRGGRPSASVAVLQKQLVTLKHDQGAFQIDYPGDWSAKAAGGTSGIPPSASIEGDDATFRIKASLVGAVVGDIVRSTGSPLEIGLSDEDGEDSQEDLAPVAEVHEMMRRRFSADYDHYEESSPNVISSAGFGEGRASTFTASTGMFGTKIKGIRATFLATDFQFNIICEAPAQQFAAFEPLFRSMIESFRR